MRFVRIIAFAALVAATAGIGAPLSSSRAHAQAVVSISFFYDRLSPYGEWIQRPPWGWVWYPTRVDGNWRPYLNGRWIWTDEYGWYWQSDEDWGWATYHYGRWTYDSQYGWLWVPGTVWGPGWVAWRIGNAYVGWAALPPGVDYSDTGLVWDGIDMFDDAYEPYWVFVAGRLFLGRDLGRYAYPRSRNRYLLRATRNATRYDRRNGRIVNRGPAPTQITRRFRRQVPTMRAHRVNTPQTAGRVTRGNVLNVFRPRVTRNAALRPPTRANPTPPRTRGQRRATPGRPPATPRTAPPAQRTPRSPATRPETRRPTETRPPTRMQPPRSTAPSRVQPPTRRQPRTQPRRSTPPSGVRPPTRRQPQTRVRPNPAPTRPQARPPVSRQPRTRTQPRRTPTPPRARTPARTQPHKAAPKAQQPRKSPQEDR